MPYKIRFLLVWLGSLSWSIGLGLLLSIPLFFFELANSKDFADQVLLAKPAIQHNFMQLMGYLLNPFNHELVMRDFSSSAMGLKHFKEVKFLFGLDLVVALGSLPFIYQVMKSTYIKLYYQAVRLALLLPILLFFLTSVLGFDSLFRGFHVLAFRNQDWLFDPRLDPVITILPESYFMHCAVVVFVIYWVIWLLLYLRIRRELYRGKT